MKQKIYQVDAFTDTLFSGNPAAVCIMKAFPDEVIMQKIAQENNLAETAFAVPNGERYMLRWFTPEIEVDLCGHATLATAHVLFNIYGHKEDTIHFYSPKSGDLVVERAVNDYLTLNFPKDELAAIQNLDEINKAIGLVPQRTFKGKTDYLLIYTSQDEVEALNPNFHLLNQISCRGIIASAPGDRVDFVSRFFAPNCGIPEDPVTGSAHTSMTPYWSRVLEKKRMTAEQLSPRGGHLICEDLGARVKISGKAVLYLEGEITF